SDTSDISNDTKIEIFLNALNVLENVEVVHRQKSTEYSFLDPRKVEKINESELLKAACCNLSESFETNPSVDVAFTDAVTGTRQIQMLGLAGPYIQITRENIPFIRGLAANSGLTYVPGTWVEGMQLSKGAGSVVNGFESITGQINIELRKPETADQTYLNIYASEGGRFEGNANFAFELDDKWSTALLLHGNKISKEWDRNNDGFRDMPSSANLIALNRWKYLNPNGIRLQFGVMATLMDNIGGELGFDPDVNSQTSLWGMHSELNRLEGWLKLGKVYEDLPWRSWAIQLSGVNHQYRSQFGPRVYDADQQSVYANLLYQSIISNTHHQILMGFSVQHDVYSELLQDVDYRRNETVPGGFFEYTFGGSQTFSMVAGIRGDYHNQYGLFLTPRLHLRYAFNDDLVMRASGGRGLRTANIIAENIGLLASNRQFLIQGREPEKPYGLNPEIAWNFGLNLVQSFRINNLPGSFTIDLYRTQFQDQIVVDLDAGPQEVRFYNLHGDSYSNSFQAQLDYEVLQRFDVRAAYRWYDVKTTFSGQLLDKPLVAKHRLFLNIAYETKRNWSFDYTLNWQGKKRIPNTSTNPPNYRLARHSTPFTVMHVQVTKSWKNKFDIYLGVENLFNYQQTNAILASEEPFSTFFDASLIWGPVFGRNSYLGFRYKI
ncbi:MAG: TonB-dependent receptor, partial [Saprospiraceae bacterium]|nr:TonB-dependent receptor [Saprospiraceae bacterium]